MTQPIKGESGTGSGAAAGPATERTALLRGSTTGKSPTSYTTKTHQEEEHSDDDGDDDDKSTVVDPSEADPLVRAPEPLALGRRRDTEAGGGGGGGDASGGQGGERTFMIDTDPRRFWILFFLITTTYFIACFDGSIMASSHPVITSYFHSSNSASWLSTAFLLTNTAFAPAVGRLSDTLGRKPPYLAAVCLFGLATVWCALARSMASLIAARAAAGLGAGGMMGLCGIMMSDVVDMKRRPTYQSYLNLMFGLGAASGAALGGVMADKLGWRWEFGIQVIPIGLCLAIAVLGIPADLGLQTGKAKTFAEAMKTFDHLGSLLLITSVTFLILGLNLGGNVVPWSHPLIIASLVISAVCFPVCLYAQSLHERPIMPLYLLHTSPRANLIFANFIASFLLNAILFNAPLFFQAVLQTSATTSGLYLVVPTATASVTGAMTGFMITHTQRMKWALLAGTGTYLAGTVALSSMRRGWPTWGYLLALVPGSLGQGFQFPGTVIAMLNTSAHADLAVATTTLNLWRQLGNVFGVAGSSLVLQNALRGYLWEYVTLGGEEGQDEAWKKALIDRVREKVDAVALLPDGATKDQVIMSYEAAVRATFLCTVGIAAVSVLLIVPIKLPRLTNKK
ncbi:major facilitator superfamily domain-containing protein [Whalleya microplaca]|nr:major facilitator superfamily domain-containing protein [Whalleya microplaca]